MKCKNVQNQPENDLGPEISRFEFFGRDEEIDRIKSAAAEPKIRVVNVWGPGGIGKTSLLNTIRVRGEKSESHIVTEIIDFFDMAVNMPSGFMDRLISFLPETAVSFFDSYYKAAGRVEQIEMAGISGEMLKEEQDKMETAFAACLNRFCPQRRCLVLMDTFEESGKRIREWLSGWMRKTEHVVFIVAGRKNDHWLDLLSEEHDKNSVVHLELGPLSMEASRRLVRRSEYGGKAGNEELEKLQILSGGYPILLILSVDKRWPRTLPGNPRPRRESTFTGEKYTLEKLRSMEHEALEHVRKEFREELINGALNMINLQPCAVVVLFMALLSRYFTAEMFIHVESVDIENARATLAGFQQWAFVKHDEKNDSYRLHDVIRDMVLRYTWPAVDITGEKRRHIFEKVADYYSSKLLCDIRRQENEWKENRLQFRITQGQRHETVHQASELSKQAHELKIRKSMFQAQEIYYRIMADYETGIGAYQLLFEHFLWVKDMRGCDMLKKELFSAMTDISQEYPLCLNQLDEARELIIIHRLFDKAIEILNCIDIDHDHQKSPYLKATTILYRGIAYNFKGKTEKAENEIHHAIDAFQKLERLLISKTDRNIFYTRGIKRSLARAYGSLGFGYLMAGRLSDAVAAYENALKYSKGGGMDAERSYHLNDLGYAYACLGQFDRAEFFCNEGLKIRENMLSEYLCGLSYNTLGLIEYMADKPRAGRLHCEKALTIFEKLGDRHGIGLAHRALGGIFSRIADWEDKMDDLEKAETHLFKALDIFIQRGIPAEPVYMAETYLRMGMMYKSWRRLALLNGVQDARIDEYFLKARYCLQRCIKEFKHAKSLSRQANASGRLADFYLDAGQTEPAESEIKKMERLIRDSGCDIDDLSETRLIEMKNHLREFLHPMARQQFLKARLSFIRFQKQKKEDHFIRASESFVAAYAFMVNFSSAAFELRVIIKIVSECLMKLDDKLRSNFIRLMKKNSSRYPETDFKRLINRLKDVEIV